MISEDIKMSIVLTVYNQISFVTKRLYELSQSNNKHIEFIVSDDCSSEDIEGVVEALKDNRFIYLRTPRNLGHDLNILYAMNHARSKYVMLLRTRDKVEIERIDDMIKILYLHPDASYFLFSAAYEDGKVEMALKNKTYSRGMEAIKAHKKLLNHPSGSIYNRELLVPEMAIFEKYIKDCFTDKYGFIVHSLIRMYLATKGDFVTSDIVGWVYADTSRSEDIAVNSSTNGHNVYSPLYQYPRYKCEYVFADKEISNPYRMVLIKYIVKRFYILIVSHFQVINSDNNILRHYNSKSQEFSEEEENKKFRKYTNDLTKDLDYSEQKEIQFVLRYTYFLLLTYYPMWRTIRKTIKHNRILGEVYLKLKILLASVKHKIG